MKKIYVLLLTTTHIASLFCMYVPHSIWLFSTNQSKWEPLNNIVNSTYNDHQTNKNRKKSLTLIQHKTQIIKQLYSLTCSSLAKNKLHHTKLIDLISVINDAKKNDSITEDCMQKYAYAQKNHRRPATVLFFSYLKRYNLTTKNTQECLPRLNEYLVHSQYPAFYALECNLNQQLQCNNFRSYYPLFSYIYSDKKTALEDYLDYSYDDLKRTFCDKTDKIFTYNIYIYDLFHLINIINSTKTLHPNTKEVDFGYNIIECEQNVVNNFFASLDIISLITTKNRISLLCDLIEQYNKTVKTKKNPTFEQYKAYKEYKSYKTYPYPENTIALPDFFDITLLDDNYYAFTELANLINDIKQLKTITDETIQQCVDKLYLQRNRL